MSPAANGAHHDPEEHELVRRVLGTLMSPEDVEEATRDGAGAVLSVQLYRRGAGGWAYLDTLDPEEFVEGGGPRLVQERYGGGRFQARLVSAGGKYFKQPMFRVEGAPKRETPPARELRDLDDDDDDGSRIGRLEKLVAQLVEHRAAPAAAAAVMPPDFYGAVAEVAKAMNASQASLMVPLLEALTKREQRADPSDMVELFIRGMETGKAGDRGNSFGDVVREMLPGTLNTLRELGGTTGGAGFGGPPRIAAPPAAAAPTNPSAPPAGAPAWAQVIAPYLPQLVQLATYRADPEYWSGQIVERADVEQLTFIDDALRRGAEWRGEFFALFPATQPHRSWFEMFFDGVTRELERIRDDDGDDAGAD